METEHKKVLEQLALAVVDMDEHETDNLARQAVDLGIDPYQIIQGGLAVGMEIVGKKYEQEEYYIPQLLLCSDAMYKGLAVVKPLLLQQGQNMAAKIVIGVIEGDTHDIGKSLVQMMLEAEGFDVLDLGKNVPIERFIQEAEQYDAKFICVSTLMSTTMEGMAELIRRLEKCGQRDRYNVVIGGGPVSHEFCKKIGADGYSPDAAKAVRLIKSMCL